jgi:hypothetical protein
MSREVGATFTIVGGILIDMIAVEVGCGAFVAGFGPGGGTQYQCGELNSQLPLGFITWPDKAHPKSRSSDTVQLGLKLRANCQSTGHISESE